ncbi:MAG: GNAT family N-acetyltransferase [Paucibacter sp.]|nr:GNAT family N-acetyltransferase [Roseateles sp.]
MKHSSLRKRLHVELRKAFGVLPRSLKFALYRRMAQCDPEPDARLVLKIAETKEELEACFSILHDAYVSSGFMKPHPSGMRITRYHALPTTTTLCAKFDDRVVGTISMIREGVFGFPLQSVFNLENVRAKGGQIAEISALAVHPDFRKTGGAILFPLMKFMHEYCTEYFDTQHLVIAVNPDKIELYEALLFFERLQEMAVDKYDFANGAPAVGASLDLKTANEVFKRGYRGRPPEKNLHKYFFALRLENIQKPHRRYFTTNDPVMTPDLLDHFFNKCSNVFEELDDRSKALLWSIYSLVEYRATLPMLKGKVVDGHALRQHQRYSLKCPANMLVAHNGSGESEQFALSVIEISLSGFQASSGMELTVGAEGEAEIELGHGLVSRVRVRIMRRKHTDVGEYYGFKLDEPDPAWRRCVADLEMGQTSTDLLQ